MQANRFPETPFNTVAHDRVSVLAGYGQPEPWSVIIVTAARLDKHKSAADFRSTTRCKKIAAFT